jgi:hypothetical protein
MRELTVAQKVVRSFEDANTELGHDFSFDSDCKQNLGVVQYLSVLLLRQC